MKWPNIKYKIGENHLCRSVFFSHADFADATCPVVADTPWEWKKSHRFHRYTQIFLGTFFCHADFADDADFILMGFFYSSDDTEFIRRLTAETITHGFSQMRPVRSLQIPPEVGKSPTDFHRFFLMGFLFIGWHGIYSEISCCGDYLRIFADATCPVVADTPWDWQRDSPEIP